MGNILRKLFPSKSNDNVCSLVHKTGTKVHDSNENNQVFVKSTRNTIPPTKINSLDSSPKSIRSTSLSAKSTSKNVSIVVSSDLSGSVDSESFAQKCDSPVEEESLNSIGLDNNEPSPFKRDFSNHHEILVPLEKYRPRRSNIRRSSRTNRNKVNGDRKSDISPLCDHTVNRDKPNEEMVTTEEMVVTLNNQEQPDNNDEVKDLENENYLLVDQLEPEERAKVARSRLSTLFEKRNNLLPLSISNGTYPMSEEKNVDSVNADGNGDSHQLGNVNDTQDPTRRGSLQGEDDSARVVLRPKTAKSYGNRLLIDELKKRQSALCNRMVE